MIIPDSAQVLDDLSTLSAALYEIFREAATDMLSYFRERQRPVNRSLASEMIRYEVKVRLARYGVYVDFEEDQKGALPDIDLTPLARNGLEGTFESYSFKILKADDGELPVPGRSDRKTRFYGQQLKLIRDVPADGRFRPNVVYLWDFDPEWMNPTLRLAAPKQGGPTRSTVDAFWNVAVPLPMPKARRPLVTPQPTEIPIRRKQRVNKNQQTKLRK